jgi:hypothetical protein
MLSLDDKRWGDMKGGYRIPYDPRPAFQLLEAGEQVERAWSELWEDLYHQGDVGQASYAAVPHIVRIHRQRTVVDWNTYALVATIELARGRGNNPTLPDFLKAGYESALRELAELGLGELGRADDKEATRSILGVLALWKGAPTYARILIEFSEDEILELEQQAFRDPE